MIVRTIDKQKLLELVKQYNWDPIPHEVIDHWLCIWGHNTVIETDSSPTPRASDQKSAGDPALTDEQSTGGAQAEEKSTTENSQSTED